MDIVSVIQDSFQEYEGHQSLVVFCRGCNFDCRGCYNKQEMNGDMISTAKEAIDKFATPMHDAVVFLGGEPTVWGESLVDSARYAKSKGLKTKIFTNGWLTYEVRKLIDSCVVDAFSVDFKCLNNCAAMLGFLVLDVEYVSRVSESIRMIMDAKIPLEIRTTNFDFIGRIEEVKEYVAKNFSGVNHIIQDDFNKMIRKD